MRLGFFGYVVGRAGRAAVSEHLPRVRRELKLDFVVVNGENAAGGSLYPTGSTDCGPVANFATP